MAADPYVYPGTDVLRNVPGLRDRDELAALEASVTALALAELEVVRLPGKYDLAHLQDFHRQVFGDVYPWAGQLRSVAISKPGAVFCLPQHLASYAEDVLGRLARDRWLRDRPREVFLDGLSGLWGDLNALHPFRDGNGRSTRAFLRQLSADADWPLGWAGLDPGANLHASIAAHHGDNTLMHALLDRHTAQQPVPPGPPASGRPRRATTAADTVASSDPTPLGEAPRSPQPPAPGRPGSRPAPRHPPPGPSQSR